MRHGITTLALAGAAVLAAPARAEVLAAEAAGFTTRTVISIAAPAARVYEALLEVGRWWHDEHTWSGAARNMRLEARPGGCWCESLGAGGFVEHGRVVHASPGRTLRLAASLGPLHEVGGSGLMRYQLEADGAGTKVTLSYVAAGFEPKQGLAGMAPLFDEVLNEALQRLKRYLETGEPAAPADASASP